MSNKDSKKTLEFIAIAIGAVVLAFNFIRPGELSPFISVVGIFIAAVGMTNLRCG
jgi:hypothetical protein